MSSLHAGRHPRAKAQRFLRLPDEDFRRLLGLIREVDQVELKVLVPAGAQDAACAALGVDLDPAPARQIFFLDTPDLALYRNGLVVRLRAVAGRGDDAVVKLRPVVPSHLPRALRRAGGFVVEVDSMPGMYVCSGALKRRLGPGEVARAVTGERALWELFSPRQRALLANHRPAGVDLDDLRVLGPVDARRVKVALPRLDHELAVERWTYPDGSRLLELSTRCPAATATRVAARVAAVLSGRGVDISGPQGTKTRAALEYFSGRPAAQT